MALMTGEEYVESIRKIKMEVYMFGKKVENPVDDPILRPSLNSVKMTYDLAQSPEYKDLMTVIDTSAFLWYITTDIRRRGRARKNSFPTENAGS